MHPRVFIGKLEEQLRRVREQFSEVNSSPNYYDIKPDELLNNAKTWFLRTIQNAELMEEGKTVDPLDCILRETASPGSDEVGEPSAPSITWMICNLERDQVDEIFGVSYYDNFMKMASRFGLKAYDTDGEDREGKQGV